MTQDEQKLILFHGFDDELFQRLVKGVQAIISETTPVTLAAISPSHLEKTVETMVLHVLETPGQVLRENPVIDPKELVIYLHGFPREELYNLVNGLKPLLPDRKAVAFCTSTKNNISMILGDMIQEVLVDHAYMTRPKPEAN